MFLYKSAVIKHGSHNQQSHAGSRGKGGAGGGAQKTPSVGRDDNGAGILGVKNLTDKKLGKLIDEEAKATSSVLNDLGEDIQGLAENAESVAEIRELSAQVKILNQASKLADKVPGMQGSRAKLSQLDKVNAKLEQAYEKIDSGREMKLIEEYLADGLDFIDNYRDALRNIKDGK